MLKVETLKKRQDFLRIAARGHKYVTPAFVVQSMPAPDPADDMIRVGFTVSRKIGNAVKRNRAKRRLRALVRDIFPKYAHKGYDYVLIARGYSLTRTFEKMHDELIKVLKQDYETDIS